MPPNRLRDFEHNHGRARELVGLGQSIVGITVGTVNASDLYRSALVQAVAALDSYVHGVLLDYGVEIIMGRRSPGNGSVLSLHLAAVQDLVNAADESELELRTRAHLAERLSRETFQKQIRLRKGLH